MTISDVDCKLLWARAAGICSNPDCRQDLTVILEGSESYNIGEMAHIIAKRPSGPRGRKGIGGSNTYHNLILLCPTCHTRADKAPREYPEELLKGWKADHERQIRDRGAEVRFESAESLKKAISRVLIENRSLWATFGPRSDPAVSDPGSNLYTVWDLRKLDRILPNNHRIINLVQANAHLLSEIEYDSFIKFKAHASAFEQHQFGRLDTYPLFPKEFERDFCDDERLQ
jgi:hypothetical protein